MPDIDPWEAAGPRERAAMILASARRNGRCEGCDGLGLHRNGGYCSCDAAVDLRKRDRAMLAKFKGESV